MKVRFWGTRGSIATPGPATVRFGGNTACVEVRSSSGSRVVLDCGTGARSLGLAVVAEAAASGDPANGCLLIGHTHWDHIQGLPFFAPLFEAGNEWHVYGPRGLGQSLGHTLAGQMHYEYFPVALGDLAARVTYHDLVEGVFQVGDLTVATQYLNHPALTLGYRIEADGVSVVYACDHEPYDPSLGAGGDLLASPQDARHVAFLSGADLVIHDAQYRPDEYAAKVGWGHCTAEYAVDAARLAGVGELALFHHDPTRDDEAVDALLQAACRYAAATGYDGSVVAAAEGETREVRRRGAPVGAAADTPLRSATYVPVLEELTPSVVMAARDPGPRAVLRAAADAELLSVREVDELPVSTDAGQVVVVDHDADRQAISRWRRAIAGPAAAGAAVLALTRTRPPADLDGVVTDWLVWPASVGHARTKLRAAVLRKACRWQAAPLPPDEERRLRSLHGLGLLDTEREERFDRYTRRACEAFEVPVALVSLVDADRQWFKSCAGTGTRQTPRDESLCAHAILGADVLQVPDLLADGRFADSPAATGPGHARFYAGVPLVLSDGSRVGTFCVLDDRPRLLDETQLDALRELARAVEAELELSR